MLESTTSLTCGCSDRTGADVLAAAAPQGGGGAPLKGQPADRLPCACAGSGGCSCEHDLTSTLLEQLASALAGASGALVAESCGTDTTAAKPAERNSAAEFVRLAEAARGKKPKKLSSAETRRLIRAISAGNTTSVGYLTILSVLDGWGDSAPVLYDEVDSDTHEGTGWDPGIGDPTDPSTFSEPTCVWYSMYRAIPVAPAKGSVARPTDAGGAHERAPCGLRYDYARGGDGKAPVLELCLNVMGAEAVRQLEAHTSEWENELFDLAGIGGMALAVAASLAVTIIHETAHNLGLYHCHTGGKLMGCVQDVAAYTWSAYATARLGLPDVSHTFDASDAVSRVEWEWHVGRNYRDSVPLSPTDSASSPDGYTVLQRCNSVECQRGTLLEDLAAAETIQSVGEAVAIVGAAIYVIGVATGGSGLALTGAIAAIAGAVVADVEDQLGDGLEPKTNATLEFTIDMPLTLGGNVTNCMVFNRNAPATADHGEVTCAEESDGPCWENGEGPLGFEDCVWTGPTTC